MGRSPSFCFSIKGCAGKGEDDDFSAPRQVKESPEKRRWSFRKKHVGHHVSSNNIMSEPSPLFSENQNQEATAGTFYSEKTLSDPQKVTTAEQTSPTLQFLSSEVSSGVHEEFSSTSTVLVNNNVPEHVIVIQTSIRRCLAQNELQKLKNVVKLQAAARGFLVRRQAAGTLRCIQAIVKMQALVRARHSVQSAKLIEKSNIDEFIQADVLQVKQSNKELTKTPSAIRKLVSSAFARQLLESTPKAKSIRISCDPLRPDSGWNWLERWMALTSMDQQKLILNPEDLKNNMAFDPADYEVDDGVHVIPHHASSDSLAAGNSLEVPVVEDDLITKSSRSPELSAPACVSDQLPPVQDSELQSPVHETVATENHHDQSKREAKEISMENIDASLHFEHDGNLSKTDNTEDNLKKSARNELISAEKYEGDKGLNGPRKSKNPAFAAVQAKFEELSSASDSNIYFNYVSSMVVSVSKSPYSQVDFISKEDSERKSIYSINGEEVNLHEKLSSHSPKSQGAASGYATGISVDRPKDSVTENFPEQTIFDEINHGALSDTNGLQKFDEIKAETKNDSPKLVTVQPQEKESSKNAAVHVDENAEDIYADKPSPYETPRSHTVVEASAATLSSPKSLIVRTAKSEDNSPARKIKSQLAVKNSPTRSVKSSPTHSWNDSDARRGTKDLKRPNSSGSDRTFHVDHEGRNSSKSLPSYMQLTESAKAKINTNFSHKSSVGLHHKDNLIKKRHSLPIGNEKQSFSPRMQSPKSQTSQDLKGSGVSFDNSSERRWQI
ncbi:protein IQ-DOMAIN 32-like [Phalaenopsis equestris]|uniref:protein IQ-DOMAIN 32-like n=1 Tax=Phalaenopsis equestris TaxID=78828 RepID=UPI0009E329E1|nr:protein IQ-DOMAIN 32-like [Phalaenopsis equestris]